ncbi:uncharacterized protein LOC130940313 isoform X2 [Arachis stenosperma]|uniref:uncharacterized protein LOC130940313 isoform X2 n=1 Tax=Arachis stenosperma TaxID=217475 RepID=UPI0025ABBBF3|nr:uncharacterized protein LOC130940313 isoform X2 [Arachis stenosperma]
MALSFLPSTPTLQSLKPSLPSISPPSSHAPSLMLLTSSKLTGPSPTGPFALTRRHNLSARASTSHYTPTVAEELADVTIFTASGDPIAFKDLWDQNQGIAVVALLRHFGCPCCWELASALKEAKARFDSAGVKLIAVGVGGPSKARMLAERILTARHIMFWIYIMVLVVHSLTLPVFDALRNATKNYTIEATPDNRSGVLQQGGMFVFKGKELLYARKDEGTGDHAPLDDIFEVCCRNPIA